MVFCDWISLIVDNYSDIDIDDGLFVDLKKDGSINYQVQKRLSLEGSWSEKVSVRAWAGHFELSGNPTKFLQGHNLFGSNDLQSVLSLFIRRVFDLLKIDGKTVIAAVDSGCCRVTRIDLTAMYDVGKYNNDVSSWLRSASPLLVKTRQNISVEDGTIYIGKRSKRLSCKIYNKWKECKAHILPFNRDYNNALLGWVKNKLRMEFVCRSAWLLDYCVVNDKLETITKSGDLNKYLRVVEKNKKFDSKSLSILKNWSSEIMNIVYLDLYNRKIKLPADSGRVRVDLDSVPRAVRGTLFMWQSGIDVKEELPKATYYRHKKIIDDLLGLNIAANFNGFESTRDVVPLVQPLVANSVEVPDWAYEFDLVAC